jgi:hypothetical protein
MMKKFSQKVVKCETEPPGADMLMMEKKFLERISHNLRVSRSIILSEHGLTGAFEKDIFRTIILTGTAGTFRVGSLTLHIDDELHLIAETGRPGVFLS